MSLSEARFHDLVDAAQQAVEDIFDDSDLDLDLENSAGVLTVRFENGSQVILSRQEALRQPLPLDAAQGAECGPVVHLGPLGQARARPLRRSRSPAASVGAGRPTAA